MPRGFKDAGIVVAEVILTREHSKGAFLIVEGEDDARFWETMRHLECEIIDGECKNNIVNAVQMLDKKRIVGVLGVVDDDHDQILGTRFVSPNLVFTDAHDLECIFCRSPAFYKVLAEFGDPSKIQDFEEKEGMSIRDCLLSRAIVFGQLRLAIKYFKLDINSDLICIPRFVDEKTWIINCEEFFCILAQYSPAVDENLLNKFVQKLPEADPWNIVRGHDAIAILRIGLKKVLGNIKNSIGVKDISRVLRAAMTIDELKKTKLWTDISMWELKNTAYKIITN